MNNFRIPRPGRWNGSKAGFVTLFVVLIFFLQGCAGSTGRGAFPNFRAKNLGAKDLAVLPTMGVASDELQSSILYHFDREAFRRTYDEVSFIRPRDAEAILGDKFTLDQLARSDPISFGNLTDADLILGLQVNEFAVQQFTTTETRTLYRTSTSFESTSVISDSTGDTEGPTRQRDTLITSAESNTTHREIPVTRGNIRVVLSMTAMLYDTRRGRVIWRGQRIERAQDELNELSTIELKDIVVERVMYRLNNRLTHP